MSEAQIANKLIEIILAKGYSVSLDAEGEPLLEHSRNKDEIIRNLDASDVISVYIDEGLGWFLLVWGNGEDIVSDFAANQLCEEIWKELRDATGI